jgi:tetratricopeptide (TPR) repeat protein
MSVIAKVVTLCLILPCLAVFDGFAEEPKSKPPPGKSERKIDLKTTKNYQEAIKLFEQGNEFSKKGDLNKALTAYQESIKLNSLLPDVHYNLANVYAAIDKLDDAVKEYQAAIKLNPLMPDFHRNLGLAYAMQKKGDLAKQKYEELKKLSPRHADELLQWIREGNPDASGKR